MGIDNRLDARHMAIGRLERALSRAERAANHLPQTTAGMDGIENAQSLKQEISAALSEIDLLLSRDGRVPHHG